MARQRKKPKAAEASATQAEPTSSAPPAVPDVFDQAAAAQAAGQFEAPPVPEAKPDTAARVAAAMDAAPVIRGSELEQPEAANRGEAAPGSGEPGKPLAGKLRSVLARYFHRKKVELIDDGNAGGVGIKLTYDDPAERPSEEVRQIVKAPEGNYPGFSFAAARKQWRKRIGADAEPKRAIAIRLDAERRFEAVGDQMSYEERLKAEREQGSNGPGTPS